MEDIAIVYGDTRVYEMTLLDEEGGPAQLTDLVFTAKQRPYDEDFVFQKNYPGEGIEIEGDGSTGIATVTITAEDLESIANHWHTLVWDCRHTTPSAVPITPLRGVLRVTPSISLEGSSS